MKKHIRKITVNRAQLDDATPDEVQGILDQIFGFVLELVDQKGKSAAV